jgi:hypothetical protein
VATGISTVTSSHRPRLRISGRSTAAAGGLR